MKKFGPKIEGNTSWFTQFMVKHPSTLLYLKALLFAVAEGSMIYAGPYTDTGGYVLALLGGALGAVMSLNAAYSNYEINKGSHA